LDKTCIKHQCKALILRQRTPVNLNKSHLLYLLIPVLFLLIYLPAFYTDYAYLDEIHQLWHNNDHSNFTMFLTQGRWLTGLLFQKLFASIRTIAELKNLRLFSLAGWLLTTFVWAVVFKRWITFMGFPKPLWWLGVVYVVCSISVTVYIGWASCMQVFIAVLAGLLSGHFLYLHLQKQAPSTLLSAVILSASVLLGVLSLFTYQTAFGAFLLPFFLQYLQRKAPKPDTVVVTGILVYLAVYIVYYFLFRYSLHAYKLEASTRTAISIQVLRKLSFFFSGPLPSGFSLNLLYSSKSIFSLILYPLAILVWVVSVFMRNRKGIGNRLLFMAIVFLLLSFIYLPGMIAAESFASYRTLFAFNLAVFILVLEALMYWINAPKKQAVFTWVVCIALVLSGVYTYQFQFATPLHDEYGVLKKFIATQYKPGITHIYFIRASKQLFRAKYNTRVYQDELGVPSTYRDWVPEPLVKQLVLEQTGKRLLAEKITVVQYESEEAFHQARPGLDSNALLLNINALFKTTVPH